MAKLAYFGFRFKALPGIDQFVDSMEEPMKKAATVSMAEVADVARARLKAQVNRNFRSHLTGRARFEKAFNAWAYPKNGKVSLRPAVTVQANPAWAEIFEEGGSIHPAVKRFLAIPTAEAERRGLHWAGPGEGNGRGWSRRLSRTLAAKGLGKTATVMTRGGLFLVARQKSETLFLFKLQRHVHENKRLSLVEISEESLNRLPGLFSKALERAK